MLKGMRMKSSKYFEGEGKINHNTPLSCKLSKRRQHNILGTDWCVKLKQKRACSGDIELTKRKYFHPNATVSTHATTTTANIITTSTTVTATKAKFTTINSAANTTAAAIKAEGIKGEDLGMY